MANVKVNNEVLVSEVSSEVKVHFYSTLSKRESDKGTLNAYKSAVEAIQFPVSFYKELVEIRSPKIFLEHLRVWLEKLSFSEQKELKEIFNPYEKEDILRVYDSFTLLKEKKLI